MNYMEDESLIRSLERKMGPPLGESELEQYAGENITAKAFHHYPA
jgi:hypothetical protein